MILITGSSGLIGSELCTALERRGEAIRKFDIREQQTQDITKPDSLEQALSGVRGVVHLAAVSRVADAEQDPDYCRLANAQGTKNVAQAALNAFNAGGRASNDAPPWIVFGSSREVYGQPEQLPASEQTPIRPINVYGESKVQAEQHMQAFIQERGSASILRLSNVYGNLNDQQARVIPAFSRAAAFGGTLRVEGMDKQFDFTHVRDVVTAIEKTIALLDSTATSLAPMNIASGVPVSLAQLAQLAQQNSRDDLAVDVRPSSDIFVEKYYSDPSLALQTLGWQSTITIDQGFAGLVRAYRDAGPAS